MLALEDRQWPHTTPQHEQPKTRDPSGTLSHEPVNTQAKAVGNPASPPPVYRDLVNIFSEGNVLSHTA